MVTLGWAVRRTRASPQSALSATVVQGMAVLMDDGVQPQLARWREALGAGRHDAAHL